MKLDQRLTPAAGTDLPVGHDRVPRQRPTIGHPTGPTRVTMRALQREWPSLSSQQSTVAPGNPMPPNVTSWMAKRTCLVVTHPRYHPNGETLDGPT